MNNIELHPFKPFIPENISVLILGSFPGKEQTQINGINNNQWFYGAKRNQFWKIISEVYNFELKTKKDKQDLFSKYGIGITDILLKIIRVNNSNLDNNLEIIEYNDLRIRDILKNHKIKTIFFTSRFVEEHFKKMFPDVINCEYLPSPSPRYARMTLKEKIDYYKNKLPK